MFTKSRNGGYSVLPILRWEYSGAMEYDTRLLHAKMVARIITASLNNTGNRYVSGGFVCRAVHELLDDSYFEPMLKQIETTTQLMRDDIILFAGERCITERAKYKIKELLIQYKVDVNCNVLYGVENTKTFFSN